MIMYFSCIVNWNAVELLGNTAWHLTPGLTDYVIVNYMKVVHHVTATWVSIIRNRANKKPRRRRNVKNGYIVENGTSSTLNMEPENR